MQKQEAWARFWRGGSVTSFGDRFAHGYQGELRQFWSDCFAALPDNAIVVDLGAGNGALEEIAAEYCSAAGRRLLIHAIDLAPELPARFRSSSSDDACTVHWHAGTPNESTGLESASVDAVVGNFAFEYGDDEHTVEEIARILKPEGTGRFLMHHAHSSLIQNAGNELAVLEALLEKQGFIDCIKEYLREFGEIRKPGKFEKMKASGKAEPFRARINQAHARATALVKTGNAGVLVEQVTQWIGKLVSPPVFFEPKPVLMDRLREIREELSANRSRLKDMHRAGVSEERMVRLADLFRTCGMEVEYALFNVTGEPQAVAWRVEIRKTN